MNFRKFIVVDGLDGCGKDTHARRIAELITSKGGKVMLVSHPSQRRMGRLSKRALEGSGPCARLIATVFYTADVLVSVMNLAKERDRTVIFVRYLLGTAYLPERLAPYGYAVFRRLLPFPDLALFIDIEPEVALKRIEARDATREMFETREQLDKVRSVALGLTSSDGWVRVDNSEDGERSFREVERLLASRGLI